METLKHRGQMNLLIETLRGHFREQPDVFIGGDLGFYYCTDLAQTLKPPDFMVVLDAIPDRERKSWVVWEENGRVPDVVIELLSESTAAQDRGRKKQVYAGLGVQQYYLFDPISLELVGWTLLGRAWQPLPPGADGGLDCPALGLRLSVREGVFQTRRDQWLRWVSPQGTVLPTGSEQAEQEKARAEQEKARAEQEKARAEQEKARADRLAERLRALGVDPDA